MKSEIRNPKTKIAIVGAGPAGASLAIRLARNDFRVTLIERERFPRQKLCGEFISPECFRHFRDLEVFDEMLAAGGATVAETVFYAPNGKNVRVPSEWFNKDEAGALSLSRAEMDFRLLEKARAFGIEVLENNSVVNLTLEKDKIQSLKLRSKNGNEKEIFADIFIDATGRSSILGKLVARQNNLEIGNKKIQNPKSKIENRLIGFKTHLKNARLEKGACEIYFFPNGYGGLSRVENNLANFCFLIRADAVRNHSSDAQQIIEQVIFQNKRARRALKDAEIVHGWLAVSIENFGRKNLRPARNLFAVGDAGAFIDPFTGSGMLMAFESAEILANAAMKNVSVDEIAAEYEFEHRRKFRRRLFICSILRRAAFTPGLAGAAIRALSFGSFPRKILARSTRRGEIGG